MKHLMLITLLFVTSSAFGIEAELLEELSPFYGKFIQEKAGWLQKSPVASEALQRIFTVCLDQPGLMRGTQTRFVAVCGNPLDGGTGSHVDAGLVDLYILAKSNEVIFRLQEFSTGGWGIAGSVELQQIGPHDHAFVVGSTYTGMGLSAEWHAIIAAKNTQLVKLTEITTAFDNAGAGYCDPELLTDIKTQRQASGIHQDPQCITVEYHFQFDKNSQTDDYHDLVIQESGFINGLPASRRFTIKFDPVTWRYTVPSELAYDM